VNSLARVARFFCSTALTRLCVTAPRALQLGVRLGASLLVKFIQRPRPGAFARHIRAARAAAWGSAIASMFSCSFHLFNGSDYF